MGEVCPSARRGVWLQAAEVGWANQEGSVAVAFEALDPTFAM
jgi:hypothetical protein